MNLGDLGLHGLIGSGGNVIKSIQTGIFNFEENDIVRNITVDSVNHEKSIVLISTFVDSSGFNQISRMLSAEIVSDTNIEIKRGSTSNRSNPILVSWQLIEFDDVKSMQKGIGVRDGSGKTIITIDSVDIAKSLIFYTYHMTLGGTGDVSSTYFDSRVRIISDTEIGVTTPSTFEEVYWQVVEFK